MCKPISGNLLFVMSHRVMPVTALQPCLDLVFLSEFESSNHASVGKVQKAKVAVNKRVKCTELCRFTPVASENEYCTPAPLDFRWNDKELIMISDAWNSLYDVGVDKYIMSRKRK